MSTITREEFTAMMTHLRGLYPNSTKDSSVWANVVTSYWGMLREYPPGKLRDAFRRAVAKSLDFFPPCAVIRSMMEPDALEDANNAWTEVLALSKRSGSSHSDPVATEAIRRMGGGRRLGQMTDEEIEVWGRKEFIEQYLMVTRKEEREEYTTLPAGDARKLITDLASKMGEA